jgi:hypothetical protein
MWINGYLEFPMLAYEKLHSIFELNKYWLGENYLRRFVRLMVLKHLPPSPLPLHQLVSPNVKTDPDAIIVEEAKVCAIY